MILLHPLTAAGSSPNNIINKFNTRYQIEAASTSARISKLNTKQQQVQHPLPASPALPTSGNPSTSFYQSIANPAPTTRRDPSISYQ
ncbi:uncharacterized protein H6S33_012695 [Morchella sextelata]|uniref:uncharacterized protein n=1 Tax=Morchella sextelata TaxID=1174677 RepID=UPI001D05ADC9|nr:uncharacterized protein H6S33_012695 [Morchella sextelata]KAH0610149.1 hypothetical protein H6S33_012695 [Morchella sextelata]